MGGEGGGGGGRKEGHTRTKRKDEEMVARVGNARRGNETREKHREVCMCLGGSSR